MKPSDKLVKVFLGRFQPLHNGHLKALRAAIDTSSHVVIVIGSAAGPSTPKNPWSWEERKTMIAGALNPAERAKVTITAQVDMPGEDSKWVKAVKHQVRAIAARVLGPGTKRYTLVGCHKGADTYYLSLYRGWNRDLLPQSEALNATDIRRAFFNRETWYQNIHSLVPVWADFVPGSSFAYMMSMNPELYTTLAQAHRLMVMESVSSDEAMLITLKNRLGTK